MERILLVKPPERSRFSFGAFSLAVLAAAIEDLAEVRILDATDTPEDAAVSEVWAWRPELVGVTTMSIQSVTSAASFIRALRGHPGSLRGTRIVAGGHGASGLPRPLLEAGADVVVCGEGEMTLRQLLRARDDPNVLGTARLVGGRLACTPPAPLIRDLDDLPFPARHLMPTPRDGVHLMETSRGCPHGCGFCETTRFHARRWRAFSPARVAREVRRLVTEHDAWIIEICDDNFAASHRRVREICAALRDIPLPAVFLASARADDLAADPDLIPAMAASHILRVSVGVETFDPALAPVVDKPLDPALYRAVFRRLREHGIFSVASFITGLPGARPGSSGQACELALAIEPDAARWVPFLPAPGLPIAQDRTPGEVEPRAAQEADELNRAFLAASSVRARLDAMAASGGVRAALARGVMARSAEADRSA